MKSCFFLLHYFFLRTFIIFLLAVSLSNCDYTNYEACNITYNCKNIQVGYPFWGDNRPKLCGTQDLKLSCKVDGTNSSTIINVFQNGYRGLNVLQINTSSHNMVVNQTSKLFELCGDNTQRKNITLISSLKPVKGYKDVHLVHNCVTPCNVAVSHTKFIECSDGVKKTAYYDLYNRSNLDNIRKRCSCNSSVTFPIDERALDEFKIPSVTLQSVLRKWPNITLKYEANFTACSKCSSSGGRCGSLDDSSQGGFVCYCQDGPQPEMCHSDGKKKLAVALGSGIGGVFVLGAIVAIWLYMKQKLGSSKFIDHSDSLDSSASEREKGSRYYGVPLFSYRELVEATNNFDQTNELGDGGFGIVYHGKLKDGREVAVKRLYEKNYRRIEQFMNEIHILTNLRHHNLVSLYGCTSQHCRELLLVYEYVSNGTVADHLFSKSTTSRSSLPWPVRLKIAVETATALSYLHASDIIHRDVKTNNILLDSNFCVKVADFGLSRLFPTDVTHVSTAPQGTPGYLDPEYHQCYQLTDKSDVYSFGVVLIELVSSLPAIDMDRHRHEINLSNYATNRIQRGAFDELVDPQLGFATDFRVRRMTISVAELAFQCLQHDKNFRPSMDEVLEVLKRIEGADYEALLQAEEKAKEAAEKVVNLHSSSLPPPPSPTEDDHQQLLRNHQLHSLHPPSPISVIEHWVSRSTTPSNSK